MSKKKRKPKGFENSILRILNHFYSLLFLTFTFDFYLKIKVYNIYYNII